MEKEHEPRFVLGIEGSANKVGVGKQTNIQVLSILRETS